MAKIIEALPKLKHPLTGEVEARLAEIVALIDRSSILGEYASQERLR